MMSTCPIDTTNAISAFDNVSPHDVIIGRGRKIKEHPGNLRFYALIAAHLSAYSNAPNKTKKSLIILKILNEVRSNHGASFVKFDPTTGEYVKVEDSVARITIAQSLRDELNYKSSKQHKQRRRLLKKRTSGTMDQTTTTTATASGNSSLLGPNMLATTAQPPSNLESLVQDIQSASNDALARQVSLESSQNAIMSRFYEHNNASLSLRAMMSESPGTAKQQTGLLPMPTSLADHAADMEDIFGALFQAFGSASPENSSSSSGNPFEPIPLAEQRQQQQQPEADISSFGSYGSLEADWEPFPRFV